MSSDTEHSIFGPPLSHSSVPDPCSYGQPLPWDAEEHAQQTTAAAGYDDLTNDLDSFDITTQPVQSTPIPTEINLPPAAETADASVTGAIEPPGASEPRATEIIDLEASQDPLPHNQPNDDEVTYIKTEPLESGNWMPWVGRFNGTRDDPICLDDSNNVQVYHHQTPTAHLPPSFGRTASVDPILSSREGPLIRETPTVRQSPFQESPHAPASNEVLRQFPLELDDIPNSANYFGDLPDAVPIIEEPIEGLEGRPVGGFNTPEQPVNTRSGILDDNEVTLEKALENNAGMDINPPDGRSTLTFQLQTIGASPTSLQQDLHLVNTAQPEVTPLTLSPGHYIAPRASSPAASSVTGAQAPEISSLRPESSGFQKKIKVSQKKIAKHREKQKAQNLPPQPPVQPAQLSAPGAPSRDDNIPRKQPATASASCAQNLDRKQETVIAVDSNSDATEGEESGYDSNREYEREKERYNRAKIKFHKRLQNPAITVTDEEEIEFMQRTSKFDAMTKKRNQDRQRGQEEAEEDEPIFVSQDHEAEFSRNLRSDDEDDLFHNDPRGLPRGSNSTKHAKTSKKRARSPGPGDENLDALFGKRRKDGKSKAKRSSKKSLSKQSSAKGKQPANKKVQDPKAKITKTKKGKQKAPDAPRKGPSMMDMGSLITGNIFRDAQGNGSAPTMPILDSTRKHEALKNLVASIPKEHRKAAAIDKNYLLSASRDFVGRGSCRVAEGQDGWKLKGMKCILKHHQLLGAAFMRRRERGDEEPRGGLCADQMGLGKTIMTLANIINGRKGKDEPGPKTTLIVATPALVTQWFSEIEKHCEKKFAGQVLKYFGKFKLATGDDEKAIRNFDIVLTTYGEVRKSYPKEKYPIELQTAEEKNRWWNDYYRNNRGPLHQIEFYRVVLDEAQCIKNHKSYTSIAARGLSAVHRWALSGTPIQNSVSELYPYFKFLQVPHTGSFNIFSNNYTGTNGPNQRGFDRLQLMLSRFMIRRTHADKVLGHKIITLPDATQDFHECRFSELERVIYETVRMRMIQRINRLSRSRQLDRNYSNILTMLLRLRQLTCHSLMLEKAMRDLLNREDHEKLYELANEAVNKTTRLNSDEMMRLRNMLNREQALNRGKSSEMSKFAGRGANLNEEDEDMDYEEDEGEPQGSRANRTTGLSNNIGNHHGLKFDFLKYLATLRVDQKWEELKERTLCAKCNDQPEQPYVTSCFHVYCYSCLEILQADAAARDMTKARCLECGIEFTNSRKCDDFNLTGEGEADSDSDNDDAEGFQSYKKAKKRQLGGEKQGKDWIDMAGIDILPSAKTIAIKAQIINWIEENPDVKIILYTQFIDMIRIMEKICRIERWGYSTYHGGKSHEARHKALQDFEKKGASEMRILLASLKCGGIGLNLTMAQKVIVVDPWWNDSIEQQAFCRVFRIGQVKETSMTRFIVKNTIDTNMIKMQQRKQAEIDQVMDSKSRKKLSTGELMELFGEVAEDEDGQPFIMVEDSITFPNPTADEDDEYGDEH